MELPIIKDQTNSVVSKCSSCGACCMHMGSPPFFYLPERFYSKKFKEDKRAMAEYREAAYEFFSLPEDIRADFVANHDRRCETNFVATDDSSDYDPCFWLDIETRKCKHYEHRPEICRDFEVDSPECHRMREEYLPQGTK